MKIPEFDTIHERHQFVSLIETPEEYRELDYDNTPYPKLFYMQAIAEIFYPGYSVEVVEHENIYDKNGILAYEKAVIRLLWFEKHNGEIIQRSGMHSDAEQVQYGQGKDRSLLQNANNLGHNCKGAVTRATKKAMNTYLHICSDMYKTVSPFLMEDEINRILNKIEEKSDGSENKTLSRMKKDVEWHRDLDTPKLLRMNREQYGTVLKLITK